jgi:riboflavin kinase/FMN adenylyltransferase
MLHKISGKVVRGDGYGRKLGFPTVNLDAKKPDDLKDGVYAGSADLEENRYRAGIIIGPNSKIEAHLIGFAGDAYGKNVTLEIEKFLREYKKFDTEAELITQIKKDLEQC